MDVLEHDHIEGLLEYGTPTARAASAMPASRRRLRLGTRHLVPVVVAADKDRGVEQVGVTPLVLGVQWHPQSRQQRLRLVGGSSGGGGGGATTSGASSLEIMLSDDDLYNILHSANLHANVDARVRKAMAMATASGGGGSDSEGFGRLTPESRKVVVQAATQQLQVRVQQRGSGTCDTGAGKLMELDEEMEAKLEMRGGDRQ